jgi:SsrA-binding protein
MSSPNTHAARAKNAPREGKANERRMLAENRKAKFEYDVLDKVEAGLVLLGTEVKSLRGGGANIGEAFAQVEDGELWLLDAHIAPYKQAGVYFNHEPRRKRKLLLKNAEIVRIQQKVAEKGLTLVPLTLYFLGKWVKVELAVVRGRKLHDKRDAIRER